ALVTDDSLDSDAWTELLTPAAAPLTPAFVRRFHDSASGQSSRVTAARVLARLAPPEVRTELLLEADAAQYPLLLQSLIRERDAAAALLESTLGQRPPEDAEVEQRLRLAGRQRNAAVALVRFQRDAPVEQLLIAGKDPTARTLFIVTGNDFGVAADALLRLESKFTAPTARQALWLALGQDGRLAPDQQREIVQQAGARFAVATHQTERSALEWLLRRLRPEEPLEQSAAEESDWRTTAEGQTLRMVRGPVTFLMGSPRDEPSREHLESQHTRRIDRSFAIGIYEVTVEEYLRFDPDYPYARDVSPTGDCPVSNMSWLGAVRYCRWLSEREGISEDQMCYPPLEQISESMIESMNLPADLLSRTGYRLPTEAEWEYACRSGAATRWFSGEDEQRLPNFGWSIVNSRERCWPVGSLAPNAFGLFDMMGNVHEWCQNGYPGPLQDYPAADLAGPLVDDVAEPESGLYSERGFRGSSYRSSPKASRSAQRYTYPITTRFSTMGFRIARTMPDD
ncbi:MAG: formylglycine-generating enzyme family protein, partial [Planctomycetes bacterium]|nr:formylglycine-generating enzyme family protein [Planctomycetota bacterium]